MTLNFVKNDITKMNVDCIVNAAKNSLLGGGGVDGAIHRAAGPELLKECMTLSGCETGKAKITKGYKLPAKYIIHTVGPMYQDGMHGEEKLLHNCYYNSLTLAKEHNIKTIAFPLISAGIFGYPKKEALTIAINAIKQFGKKNQDCEMIVTMVIFGDTTANLAEELFGKLNIYLKDNYINIDYDDKKNISHKFYEKELTNHNSDKLLYYSDTDFLDTNEYFNSIYDDYENKTHISKILKKAPLNALRRESIVPKYNRKSSSDREKPSAKKSLANLIDEIDISFSEALFQIIDKKKLKDVDVYNNANIDRKLFSKIRSGSHPKKTTAIALCIALKLSLSETNNLLKKAGYALTESRKFDIIIKYFIVNRKYNINEINAALFAYDEVQLGIV